MLYYHYKTHQTSEINTRTVFFKRIFTCKTLRNALLELDIDVLVTLADASLMFSLALLQNVFLNFLYFKSNKMKYTPLYYHPREVR